MPEADRQLIHTRTMRVDAYARGDGLIDLEAAIQDVKQKDLELETHVCPARVPVHDMSLCVTIDRRMYIVAARARTTASPYEGECDAFGDAYQQLVGLNLLQGFRAALRERLGGILGCTHLTELAGVLPTAAVQAFAGEVVPIDRNSKSMPMQLGRCRALRLDGRVVARLYPHWSRAEGKREGDKQ